MNFRQSHLAARLIALAGSFFLLATVFAPTALCALGADGLGGSETGGSSPENESEQAPAKGSSESLEEITGSLSVRRGCWRRLLQSLLAVRPLRTAHLPPEPAPLTGVPVGRELQPARGFSLPLLC